MARTTKAQRESNAAIGTAICALLFSPFLLFSVFKYFSLKRQYMSGENFHRVVDIGTIKQPIMAAVALVILTYIGVGVTHDSVPAVSAIILCIMVFLAFKMAQWVAVKYIGAIIDADNGVVIFPPDMQSYGVEDYFTLRILKDMSRLDMVKIADIEKMTRQAGKRLYLHGKFGSRGIFFSDKQKRDECLSAIQQLAGKGVLMYELEQS
jgi:hypothetical protein